MKSKNFDALLDYLERTDSSVVIPQVVLDEVSAKYNRHLNDNIARIEKSTNRLKRMLTVGDRILNSPSIDFEAETIKYVDFVKKKLKINEKNFLPYNHDLLPEIIRRAIHREKPCKDNGTGVRDALIWLTILEYSGKCREKQITFISNNHTDFGSKEEANLHEILSQECTNQGVQINYFRSVKEFIENHSIKIDFLTLDWLSKNLDYDLVCQYSEDELLHNDSYSNIISKLQYETGEDIEGFNVRYIETIEEKDLYAYEMIDDTLIVNVTILAIIGLDVNYCRLLGQGNDYAYMKGSSDFSLEAEIYVSLEVENEIISNIELIEISA